MNELLNNGKKTKENKHFSIAGGWRLLLELMVVFIGVSAGFLFDNFREDRSDRKLEEKYLQSFYNDVVADSIEIQDMLLSSIDNIEIRAQMVYYYRSHIDMRYVEGIYNEYITNHIIPYVSKKLDFLSGEFVEDFSVDNIEFWNITSGYHVLARQKAEWVQTLDSLNNGLRKELAAQLNSLYVVRDPAE